MKRYKVNKQKSGKRYASTARKTHKMNKLSPSTFIRRGGVRL